MQGEALVSARGVGMNRTSTPPPANTITVLSADLLATRAGELLSQLACGTWPPAQKLREALQTYSEVRLGVAMAEGADAVLRHVEEETPKTLRTGEARP